MELIDEANQKFLNEKDKYQFHIHPKKGWSNDPNGLVYFKGRYHVFFQCNPFENNNNQIFWAHVSSKDLIKWRREPFALAPDKDYDREGCFSGSAIVEKGKLYLFYTGHKNLETNYSETINVAVSENGIYFDKIDQNPLVRIPPENNSFRFRDPKIWKEDNFYMAIGGENKDGHGQVSLYESTDILGPWRFKSTLAKAKNDEGNMWECPDFFTIGNRQVLLASPKGLKTSYKNGFESVFVTQNFSFPSEIERRIEVIDQGINFYAPQTFFDPKKKRRILFGWLGLPGEQEKEKRNLQSGALTLPRELTWQCNKLYMYPIEEVDHLREKASVITDVKKQSITNHCELILQGKVSYVSLCLQSNKAYLRIYYENGKIIIEQSDSIRNSKSIIKVCEIDEIRLFIDNNLIELFVNYGESVWSNKCDFDENLSIEKEGDGELVYYPIKNIFY